VAAVQRGAIAEVGRRVDDVERDVRQLDGRVVRFEARVDEDTGRIEARVDDHAERIADLRESHARVDGQVKHLVKAYERAATVATSQVLTDLEVRKADALAEIRDRGLDRKAKRAVWRELAFKLIAIGMGLWALVAAFLQSKC
jgi:hypothetical protein